MSRNVLEKVLFDLSTSGANKKAFAEAPDKFLGRYQLNEAEKSLILNYEVRALADLGVNTMLTWGFWLQSGRKNGDYMKAMKAKKTV
jgi:Aromatic-ring-opening dioxygenase LigAB, LigA subunit